MCWIMQDVTAHTTTFLSASRNPQRYIEHACQVLDTCEYWEKCLCQTLWTLTWLLYKHVTSHWPIMSLGIWHGCISVQQPSFNIQAMFTCVVTPPYLLATSQRTFFQPAWAIYHAHTQLISTLKKAGKAIPVQAWSGPDSRRFRLPYLKTIGKWRW
jgi:hypothetical protein